MKQRRFGLLEPKSQVLACTFWADSGLTRLHQLSVHSTRNARSCMRIARLDAVVANLRRDVLNVGLADACAPLASIPSPIDAQDPLRYFQLGTTLPASGGRRRQPEPVSRSADFAGVGRDNELTVHANARFCTPAPAQPASKVRAMAAGSVKARSDWVLQDAHS